MDWTALMIAAGYLGAALVALPVAAVTMLAGYTYGVGWGMVMVVPLAVMGALTSFAVGRTVLRHRIERRLERDRWFAAIDRAIGEQGFRITLLFRLSPLLPYGALNYALSATSVRPSTYAAASTLGVMPGTLLYLYLGAIAGGPDPLAGPLGVVGIVATVVAVVAVARIARRAARGLEDA